MSEESVRKQVRFRPLGDKVLLLFPEEDRVEGGVIVDARLSAGRRSDCVVVAKGRRVPDDIGVGDTVYADPLGGIPVGLDGVRYRLMGSNEVRAVAVQRSKGT